MSTANSLSQEEIEGFKRLCDEASEGEWRCSPIKPLAIEIVNGSPLIAHYEIERTDGDGITEQLAIVPGAEKYALPDAQFIAAARTALPKLLAERAQYQWQPMETAPTDGREVLVRVKRGVTGGESLVGHYMPGGHCIEDHPPIDDGWYFWNGRMFDKAAKPTHWMPLPAPPLRDSTHE